MHTSKRITTSWMQWIGAILVPQCVKLKALGKMQAVTVGEVIEHAPVS